MSVVEQQPVKTRRSFPDELKRDAVSMVLDEVCQIVDVARRLGVGDGTLGTGFARPVPIGVSGRG